ncbi:MAG: response regulator [bacterium]
MKSLKKVLYIDSDNSLCKVVKKNLSDNSFDCITAENGEEGLKNILHSKPDIIFVDNYLSDMDTEIFIQKIKDQSVYKNLKDIPLILLTSNGKMNKLRLDELGFCSYIHKPFNTQDLINLIDGILHFNVYAQNKNINHNNGRQFLESILESSVESIFTTNKKGYITYSNKACLQLLKYSFKEFIGKNICELLNNGSSELLQILDIINKDGKLTDYKTFLIEKTKKKIPVSLFLSPMKEIDGDIIGYLALTVHQNNDINKSSSHKSEKLATILETAITVNHAINNPLVPILGQAQFLLQDERIVDEDIRKRLNIIINNALRIKNITQKLTRISKPVSKEYIKGTKMLDLDASI